MTLVLEPFSPTARWIQLSAGLTPLHHSSTQLEVPASLTWSLASAPSRKRRSSPHCHQSIFVIANFGWRTFQISFIVTKPLPLQVFCNRQSVQSTDNESTMLIPHGIGTNEETGKIFVEKCLKTLHICEFAPIRLCWSCQCAQPGNCMGGRAQKYFHFFRWSNYIQYISWFNAYNWRLKYLTVKMKSLISFVRACKLLCWKRCKLLCWIRCRKQHIFNEAQSS